MVRYIRPPGRSPRPKIVFTASKKGGVGKTTTIVAVHDLFDLHGQPMIVVQLDRQDRLAKTIRGEVITLSTEILRASRNDPGAGLKAFRPLMEAFERAARSGEIILFDIGASLVEQFMAFASLAGLDEDLREWNLPGIVLVPGLGEPEALHQAAVTIAAFRDVLPSITPIFVENQRDGTIADLVVGSEAHRIFGDELEPLLTTTRRIVMPSVAGRSWALFERHFCRPLQVVAMDIGQVMALTALPRAEAKIARGDVAAWVATLEIELSPILGLGGKQ